MVPSQIKTAVHCSAQRAMAARCRRTTHNVTNNRSPRVARNTKGFTFQPVHSCRQIYIFHRLELPVPTYLTYGWNAITLDCCFFFTPSIESRKGDDFLKSSWYIVIMCPNPEFASGHHLSIPSVLANSPARACKERQMQEQPVFLS